MKTLIIALAIILCMAPSAFPQKHQCGQMCADEIQAAKRALEIAISNAQVNEAADRELERSYERREQKARMPKQPDLLDQMILKSMDPD